MILVNDEAKSYIGRSKYFKPHEFACRCGCGKFMIDTVLVDLLDEFRAQLGLPVIINSGFRCEKHNSETSGAAKDSQHTKGRAADIRTSPFHKQDLIKLARDLGFTGIGVNYGTFVHLDVREGSRVEF